MTTKTKQAKAADAKSAKPKPPKPSNGTLVLPEAKVELCVAKNDVRYYLNFPYLDLTDPKKPMLLGCNGHYLAAAPVRIKGEVQPGPLPIEAINAARKSASKAGVPTLVFDGFMVGTGVHMFKRPDHGLMFPDWRKAVPDTKGREHDIALNASYIALMARALSDGNFNCLRIYCGRDDKNAVDSTQAAVFRTSPESDAFGVVMPMRALP